MSEMNLAARVNQEAVLDISIDRVDKIPAPLLVIGLGGTGVDILKKVKSFFAERFVLPTDKEGRTIPIPPYTAYLGIDTDTEAKGVLSNHEFLDITLTGMDRILSPDVRASTLKPEELTWVHDRLTAEAAGKGAGGMRQAARFMLNRDYNRVRDAITGALKEITHVQAGSGVNLGRIEVAICTGICGGTGSGTFLDIPQIVRHCVRNEPSLAGKDLRITGYIVMPDVSTTVATDASMKKKMEANGYAALKELDFWMRVDKHKTPYFVKYCASDTVQWIRAPYDACILLSGINVKHTAFTNPVQVVQQLVAENLLHYMANERPNADGNVQFSYMSHENNLSGYVATMPKSLPLGYCYRAIGAYSKKIPKKRMLYYESQLLFRDFMPLRDEYNRLVPDAAMLQDGKTMDRSAKIRGDMKAQMQKFCSGAPLPSWCGVDPADDNALMNLRNASVQPHDRRDHPNYGMWLTRVINPQASKFGEMYFEECWDTFKKFCSAVMQDVKKGPFALLHYLEHENGLMVQLKKDVASIVSAASNSAGAVQAAYNNCKNTWGDFFRPPMMGKRKAIENYLTNMKNFYATMRQVAFRNVVAQQQEKLLKRINEYIRDGLKPLCEDLEVMDREFAALDVQDEATPDELFAVVTMKERIDEQFAQENSEYRLTRQFLNNMIELSYETERNVDTTSSGVRFLYYYKGQTNKYGPLIDMLDECFGKMNHLSLDDFMEMTVGEDLEQQQIYMSKLFQSIRGSSMPMFAMDGAASENYIPYSYMAVPDNAEQHLEYFNTVNKAQVVVKGSSLHDHIYCITAYDGLTMSSYSQMSVMQKSYEEMLNNPAVALGLHLVWDGRFDSDFTRNWTKLPSPKPMYFYMGQGCAQSELDEFEKACSTVKRAIKAGMLKVDATQQRPVLTFSNFYTDSTRVTMQPSQFIVARVDEIMKAVKNPRTGEAVTMEQKREQLYAMRDEAYQTYVPTEQSPLVLDVYCGVQGMDIDPWEPNIAAHAIRKANAEKEFAKLAEVLAAAVLVDRPVLLRTVNEQLEGFERLNAEIEKIERTGNLWEPRMEYVDTFADLWLMGGVFAGMSSVRYKTATGKKQNLIDEDLLADDMKDMPQIVQACCYLADVTEENPVRDHLERELAKFNTRMEEDEDSFDADEIQDLVDNATELQSTLESDLLEMEEAATKRGAPVDHLKKVIALQERMKNHNANRLRFFKRVLRNL